MKKLTSLLIGCSLALAGAALAQQPVEQESTSKGKRAREKKRTGEYGGQGEEAGPAAGAANQIAARELPRATKAAAGSGGYLQPELSDSRKRTVAGSAI